MFCKQQMPLDTQTEHNTDNFQLCVYVHNLKQKWRMLL